MRRPVPLLVAALLTAVPAVAGCDGGRPAAAPATTVPATTAPATAQPSGTPNACPSSAEFPADPNGPELHGGGPGTDLWALLFLTGPTIRPGAETKIVWRMTGAGELTIRATGPGGAQTQPVWGPEPHGGSTWQRPGDEWGTGWKFSAPGCWTITATRAKAGAAKLTLRVAP